MKTGILTYHNTRNSGALLQAYALQTILNRMSIENKIIDYRCENIDNAYKIKKIGDNKNLKALIKWCLTIKNDRICQKKFDAFKEKYLNISKTYDRNSIFDSNYEFDNFITGSDQVWNMRLNGNDTTYLLDFVRDGKQRISYAASMGASKIEQQYCQSFKSNLLKFDNISVREENLQNDLKDMFGIETKLVLDPTLLLEKEDYNFDCSLNSKQKYIFVYTIAGTPHIEKAAKNLAKSLGCKIIWGHMSYRKRRGVVNKTSISPEEFIYYIKNAEYVLTSSFHGMALSIVFEKQFFYDLDRGKQNNNSRLITLSDALQLNDRELVAETVDNMLDKAAVDYLIVNEKLDALRASSIEFIKRNIKNQGD